MNPGVYYDMSRTEYQLIPRHNQTTLKRWLSLGDIPSEFAYWRDSQHDDEKDCFLVGQALDCLLLEPDKYNDRFAVGPVGNRQTKAGKEAWADFLKISCNHQILTASQGHLVSKMADALKNSQKVSDVFKHCQKAVLIADLFGFPCKGEVDLWDGGKKTEHIWDVKQLKDVSRKGFKKAFIEWGYDIQATFYLSLAMSLGFEKTIFSFICVKNSPPYTVRVHSFEPKTKPRHDLLYNICLSEIQTSLEELDRRIKSDDFKDDDDWESIDIPEWRLRTAIDATR